MHGNDPRLGTMIALWQRHLTINHGTLLVCPQRTEDGFPTFKLVPTEKQPAYCPNCHALLEHPQPINDGSGDQRWSR
jgi:hypothetical protein